MSQSTTILLSTPAAATTSALVQVIETSTGKGKAAVFSGIKHDLAFGLNSEMHCNTGMLPVKFRVSPSERCKLDTTPTHPMCVLSRSLHLFCYSSAVLPPPRSRSSRHGQRCV